MNGSETPLICILLATYEPRLDWLRELLLSLNGQTYPNLFLRVRDDGSARPTFEAVCTLIGSTVTAFPYAIERNETNLGSNRTFELLTAEGSGAYFAYCDQDDLWLPEKLSVLAEILDRTGAGLACSDVIPVDEGGKPLANSITEIRPRHVFRCGVGLAPELVYRNFVMGCTMLIRGDIAKAALPFAQNMVHDHYLAFYTAREHGIEVAPRPLVQYRLHEGNQTGVLVRVHTKEEYLTLYLQPFCRRVAELRDRFPEDVPEEAARWADARVANAAHRAGGFRALFALRRVNRAATLFELLALRFPEPLFRLVVGLIQRGKL